MSTPVFEGQWHCPLGCVFVWQDSAAPRVYPSLEGVTHHVSEQHPDYDPMWFETYPEDKGVTPE